MTNSPTISTVMSAYNAQSFIAQAIDSILQQTRPSDEIIVIDDGSTDNTLKILQSYPMLTIISRENKGLAASLNEAISLASGDYLTFLDADDIWHPKKNEMQLQCFKAHKNIDMVFTHIANFSNATGGIADAKPGLMKISLFIPREKFLEVGPFDILASGDFIAWFQRAVDRGLKYEMMTDVLVKRRVHGHNFTQTSEYANNLPQLAKLLIEAKRKRSLALNTEVLE